MMKRLTLFICTLICANVLIAQTQFTIGSITYEVIDSNEVKIYDYSGTDSVLVIPDTVAYQNVSYTVTKIGDHAFASSQSLTTITIPNSVTAIEHDAFYGCSSLQSISIPSNVSTIGSRAFMNCTNLISISMPDSITTITWNTFDNCSSLTSITIPQSVTMILFFAFQNCTSLQEVISLSSTPPTLYGSNIFLGIPNSAVLKVPCHTDEYASSYWGNYFNTIQRIEGSGFYATTNVNNSNWGSVEIENNCTNTATLTATANNCYQFQQWSDGNTDNPRSISLHQDSSFTAIFDLADNYNIHIYDSICQGETYTDNDFYAIETGIYTRRLISSNGCDSAITLHLTVNQHTTGIDTVVACNSYTWIDDITYTQSTNRPTYTLTNSGGCDSIVTLNLTILECIYTLTANVFNNDTTGTVIGSGQYMHGDTATIMALANNGFHFVQWKNGSVENPRKVVVTSDTTFSAIFGANPPVAINDSKQLESLTLHPNPTSGIITFDRTDIQKVEIIDAMGRLLMTIENKHIIDLSKLNEGYYTLRITLPKDTIVRKVIKQ